MWTSGCTPSSTRRASWCSRRAAPSSSKPPAAEAPPCAASPPPLLSTAANASATGPATVAARIPTSEYGHASSHSARWLRMRLAAAAPLPASSASCSSRAASRCCAGRSALSGGPDGSATLPNRATTRRTSSAVRHMRSSSGPAERQNGDDASASRRQPATKRSASSNAPNRPHACTYSRASNAPGGAPRSRSDEKTPVSSSSWLRVWQHATAACSAYASGPPEKCGALATIVANTSLSRASASATARVRKVRVSRPRGGGGGRLAAGVSRRHGGCARRPPQAGRAMPGGAPALACCLHRPLADSQTRRRNRVTA